MRVKCTPQCPGLKSGLLDPETSALTMRPLSLPHAGFNFTKLSLAHFATKEKKLVCREVNWSLAPLVSSKKFTMVCARYFCGCVSSQFLEIRKIPTLNEVPLK